MNEACEKRRHLDLLAAQLETERATFLTHWRNLSDYIMPRRPRFDQFDINKGDRRSQYIIDSTATFAARTLSSGMMAGITSPARPWFRLGVENDEKNERGAVKVWLSEVTKQMSNVFTKSNIYNTLPNIYLDMGIFGTAAMLIEEDFEKVIRTKAIPIGSYNISVNQYGQVDTFHRKFQMTVRQIVSKFGMVPGQKEIDWSKISTYVKDMWKNGNKELWVQLCHIIKPNHEYDPAKPFGKYRMYESIYYEEGTYGSEQNYTSPDASKYLSESGYDFFPVLVPRWSVTGEDSYATDCPGMTALGDIKGLQILQKRKGNAVDKVINPPLVGSPALKHTRISHLPGDVSFSQEREGEKGLRPIYQINFDFSAALEDIREHQQRIKTSFYEDLFLMLTNDERTQPPTAEEIIERRSEKMIAIGPVLEQLNQDLLDPLIDITFNMMERQGLLEEVPEELSGQELKVEYISILAQAQKLIATSTIERFTGFTTKMAMETQDPAIFDKIDKDQLIDEYAEALGVSPKIVRTDEQVAQIRAQRAKQAQAAQMAQQAETLKAGTSAIKDLATSPTADGGSALDELMARANAGNPVNAA